MLKLLKSDLDNLKDSKRAEIYARFFKTKKGEYGEGDTFLGITVPNQRKVAKNYTNLSLEDIQFLLLSNIHEYRLTALIILMDKYKKANDNDKKKIFDLYIKNTKNINNWDLVDISAPHILGDYLLDKDRKILYTFAKSENLWKKRIAILSTFTFIRNNDFKDTINISEIFLNDTHDLIHKAVGWSLRELGKKNQPIEEEFLKKHYKTMPRTMLRYAIERFDEDKRQYYLNK
ncbi:DNA alkylation repair protein [archaeon]|nr:DNA alkylation repair protein [archaeon]